MMRLSLISVGPPYRGGISDLSALLYQELSSEHTLQFINFSRQYPSILFPGKTEYKVGSQAAVMPTERVIDSLNPLSWFRAARSIKSFNPNAVIFRYWHPFFAPLINVMSRRLKQWGIPVSVLVDNLIPHEESVLDTFMARRVLAHATTAFTMSQAVSADIHKHIPHIAVHTLFHPNYEIYQKTLSKEAARKQLGLNDSAPVIMYFGLIRPYKGLDILIKALGRLKGKIPGLHSLILGEAYEDVQQYRDLIQSEGVSDQVTFDNRFVPDDELPLYFAACDVLVLPYRTATQSGIVGIAFQMDRPVIATLVGGLGEYIEDGETGYLVPPEDPAALGDAILKFFAENRASSMSEAVRSSKHKFSIQSFCQQLLEGLPVV
jgi:glycosyltransferase involved in cell wall biosynthesis